MRAWTVTLLGGLMGCVVLCLAAYAVLSSEPTAARAPGDRPSFSGVYPHLAVTNGGTSESGIGAVVPWAGKLWFLTYPAHQFKGSDDRLYELDAALNLVARPESVGDTHANRMIHRESNQLIIGSYFIDAKGNVRAISPAIMPGRLTSVTRHLTDPANKVYFATMEQGFYEVDVRTLDVKELHKDRNVGGKNMLPGVHGKGCYTGQGQLIYSNNGNGGALAEWNGKKDIGSLDAWTIVDRNKYTDITGPGGIYGAPDDAAPVWAIGWDAKSVLLNVRDGAKWTRFRLPKASYTQDADHGWYTEWPRIREVGGGHVLLNMHDMFYDFPKTFRPGKAAGLRPISTFLKMVVDYTNWDGRLVMVNNDASCQGNPILGRPESNIWFGKWEDLHSFGKPAGWGGPWVKGAVKAGEPSEPFLLAGFERRVVHLAHDAGAPVVFTLETDAAGDGTWAKLASVTVPASGYAYYVIPPEAAGEWVRVKTDRDVKSATAYFHYFSGAQATQPAMFRSLAAADQTARRSEGILRCTGGEYMVLQFAATIVDDSGKAAETGYYVMGADLKLRRTDDAAAENTLCENWAPKQDVTIDAASVIVKDKKGNRYRLPKGPDAFASPSAAGWPRGVREIVTERNMLNAGGTLYELPHEDSGGILKARPITTHNRRIFDFASWRGLLVLAGNLSGAAADGHYVASDDGKVGLWLGNVEDLWKLGPPRGEGGPWKNSAVKAGEPSDPYLMTGYDRKAVQLSHDRPGDVKFTIEVDFLASGHFHTYNTITVPAGKTVTHAFPAGFAAHWVRLKADADCKATAWFVYEVDWTLGEVMKALDGKKLAESTLLIITSDNGSTLLELKEYGHTPNAPYRGRKSDIWDGGHREPFIARWPGKIKPSMVCDETIWLGDLMATCAAIVGAKLPSDAGEDSCNILPALTGQPHEKPIRPAVVHHSIDGMFAIREGKWKLVLGRGSGGWDGKGGPSDPEGQLYDMEKDFAEAENLYAKHPEIVQRLTALLEKYKADGRSRPK